MKLSGFWWNADSIETVLVSDLTSEELLELMKLRLRL